MRRHSIAEARSKLSREWLAEGPIELTANNIVVATINPSGLDTVATDPRTQAHQVGVAAPTPVTPTRVSSDPRVPRTGVAAPRGLSKSDQASGKSRLR